jgi:hypothetical protein
MDSGWLDCASVRPMEAKSRQVLASAAELTHGPTSTGSASAGSESSGGRNDGRRGELSHTRSVLGIAALLPFGIAAVYLLLFVVKLPGNIREIAWISDYTTGFTVTEAVAKTGTEGHTVLASSGQWVSLWFGLLTARLPLHRELWSIAPTLLFFATALTIGWSVSQIATRRAALLSILLVLVASRVALMIFMAAVNHNALYPCTALAGAYLVWLAQGRRRRRVVVFGVPLCVGIVLGVCLASDLLTLATAILPLSITGVLAGLRRSSRSRIVGLSALASAAVSVPVAKLTSVTMESAGFALLPTPSKLVPSSLLGTQAQFFWEGLKALFNGTIGQVETGFLHSGLEVACDILLVTALLALLGFGVRVTVNFIRTARRRDGAGADDRLALSLHTIYWVGSAIGACLVVVLTADMSAANFHESYYATVILSIAAIVPLLVSRRSRARWLVVAGVSVFFAASVVGLVSRHKTFPLSIARYESEIVHIAKTYHVDTGYAGYWDASSLTWSSGNRVLARPVMTCQSPTGANICPFYMERVPTWYVPRQRRTFVLLDAAEVWLDALPEGLGRPLAAFAIGPVRMYIYSYDVASRFGPPVAY